MRAETSAINFGWLSPGSRRCSIHKVWEVLLVSLRPSTGALCAVLLFAASVAHAEDWPTRPIRVISPFAAGSASDTVSRVVLDRVSQLLGQPMVIEAKPGAGGIVGFADVAKADPDGYTLVTSSTSMGTGLVLHAQLPYDPDKDFESIAMFGVQPNVLVASTESGFRMVADLVAAAKAKPGTLTFASAGIGSSSHMAAEKLKLAAKIDVRHIPFKDQGLTEVMAGRIDFYFIPLAAAAKTSREVVDKLHDATERALQDTALQQALANLGVEPQQMSVEAFAKFVKDDL